MKKKTLLVFILIVAMLFVTTPAVSHGWSHHGHHHGYYHGHGYCGWEAAAIVGGSILLGTLIGLAVNNSARYASPPRAYVYPEPRQAYAYPDPSLTNSYPGLKERKTDPDPVYGSRDNFSGNPPGVWVKVPGQWVRGTWVPAHKVWVPVNP
ncbi:MAG: hypothetical protein GXY80_10655 [Syntrophorhabdus aromaticivorans]|uniref:Uncharacterized protein n=1 Tax=Syntrophorhabdus aromaticivorans TaxID=328301 RepID=A0A351U1I0_9BACT|nr:hypothetical protein [Syntrophorhabdus aromaticivorans]HBA53811.1 hypothetical protein [Syntrophorhabdus aromaticivorans]